MCSNTLFYIGEDKTGSRTYDAVYIKDSNSVAVSSADGEHKCITMIDIESQEVVTTISMDTDIFGMVVRGRTMYYCTLNKGIKMVTGQYHSTIWKQRASSDSTPLDVDLFFQIQLYIFN
jgi:ribosomal protein S4E